MSDSAAKIKAALSQMSPGPWEADVDDPETSPQWTRKFYIGDRGARGVSWCTYDDSDPDTLPNVRGVAALVSEVPALLAEVGDLRRGAHDAAVAVVERDKAFDQIRELEIEIATLRGELEAAHALTRRVHADHELHCGKLVLRLEGAREEVGQLRWQTTLQEREICAWRSAWSERNAVERRRDAESEARYAAALERLRDRGLCPHRPEIPAAECGTCTPCSCPSPVDVMYGGNREECSVCHRDIPSGRP